MNPTSTLPRLMLITGRQEAAGRDLIDVVAAAAHAGVRLIQVREKDLPGDVLEELVADLRSAVPQETIFLINGRLQAALDTGNGYHLPAAYPLPKGPLPRLWGRSAHNLVEVRRALREGALYLQVGPIYPTASKPGHPGSGQELVKKAHARAAGIPLFAAGGITPGRVAGVLQAGAYGVAVRAGIIAARDPAQATREYLSALHI